jgi:hypothetical protein
VTQLNACWQGRFDHHKNIRILNVVVMCTIWRVRNNRIFDSFGCPWHSSFLSFLFDWMTALANVRPTSLFYFLDLLNLRI